MTNCFPDGVDDETPVADGLLLGSCEHGTVFIAHVGEDGTVISIAALSQEVARQFVARLNLELEPIGDKSRTSLN